MVCRMTESLGVVYLTEEAQKSLQGFIANQLQYPSYPEDGLPFTAVDAQPSGWLDIIFTSQAGNSVPIRLAPVAVVGLYRG